MIDIERRGIILKRLEEQHIVKVSDLSKELFIGEATIRRDLAKLEKAGYLKRIYGGAVHRDKIDRELPADVRRYENTEKKQAIASYASELISDNQIISIDSSTTCFFLAEVIKEYQNLTILTHSQPLIKELQYSSTNLYCSGGLLSKHTFSYGGEFARNFFSSFYADLSFISCKGISIIHGITLAYDEEASLRKIMLQHSNKRILLCDSTKFDKISTSRLFGFELIDILVTDTKPSQEWITYLQSENVQLICPGNIPTLP